MPFKLNLRLAGWVNPLKTNSHFNLGVKVTCTRPMYESAWLAHASALASQSSSTGHGKVACTRMGWPMHAGVL